MRENSVIVLIGPMGAGKSTVGRILASILGKQFLDSDEQIEKNAGASIPYIFEAEGRRAPLGISSPEKELSWQQAAGQYSQPIPESSSSATASWSSLRPRSGSRPREPQRATTGPFSGGRTGLRFWAQFMRSASPSMRSAPTAGY